MMPEPYVDPTIGSASEELLQLADWAVACLRGSTDYVQVFAECTLEVRIECRDGDVLSTCIEPRSGLGIMTRQGNVWRHLVAPPSKVQDVPEWLSSCRSSSNSKPPRFPMPGRVALLETQLDFTPIEPHQWLIVERVATHSLRSLEDFTSRLFAVVDTEGVRIAGLTRHVRQRIEIIVEDNGERHVGLSRRLHHAPQLETLPDPQGLSLLALGRALNSAKARLTGEHQTPVVFGPSAGAGFLHELLGHALEGDNFALRSEYITRLRQPGVIPTSLKISDDPRIADGYGSYAYDDEGVSASTTVLVANGEIQRPLSSVCTIFKNGYTPTGNGRRANYRSLPIPRASNTVVSTGTEDASGFIKCPQGVLLIGSVGSGTINLVTGDFSFAALNCVFITPHGNHQPVRDVTIFGSAIEALAKLDALGTDFGGDNATCGKQGQMIGIGIYSPSIRFSSMNWSAA